MCELDETQYLTMNLTNQEFQNTLKEKFLSASYNITRVGERGLVPSQVKDYLNSFITDSDREFAEAVLLKTLYISDTQLTDELTRVAKEFVDFMDGQPYYIFLNRYKFSSTELMTIKVMHIIKKSNWVGFVTDESILPNGSHVAIIDDASYSGINLEAATESLITFNRPNNITIHAVIPYISKFMHNKLPELYNIRMYSSNTFLTIDQCRVAEGKPAFPDSAYERFKAIDTVEFHSQLPLYFDHTVASPDSSFPTIYLQGIIPGREPYGKLISYDPDKEVRHRVYNSYFTGLLPSPMPLK
jgi:hypothetical protein